VSRWMLIPAPTVIIFFDLVYQPLCQHLSEHCGENPNRMAVVITRRTLSVLRSGQPATTSAATGGH
jgi:hypothetical protein